MTSLRSSLFCLLLCLASFELKAQIINPYFKDWHWVTLAQPYLDPTGWTTNNYNQFGGVACTPIDRISDSTGYYAHVASSACGVDAVLSGVMSQRIPAKNLDRLNIVSKCDSLWGTGRCVISVMGHDYSDILYTDSIAAEESEFQTHTIDILDEWKLNNDSITIQLTAKGNIDMWDEEEDGYSIFLVDQVKADLHFLVPGRQWIYAHNVYDYLPDPLVEQTIETITIGNDTMINGFNYSMLTATLAAPCGIFDTTEFLREEGEKIYRLSEDHSQEYLMIDFDETTGYEMLYDNLGGGIDTAEAIIDSFGVELTFDGTPIDVQYMRIHNNHSYDEDTEYKVYKNFGFVQYGLLFPDLGTGLCDVMEGIQFRCSVDGTDTVHFTEFGCFEITLMDATKEPVFSSIHLSPNPASNEIYIPEGYNLKAVCTIQGQPMMTHLIGNTVYTDSWPAGVYVLWLTSYDNKNVRVGRILKQ